MENNFADYETSKILKELGFTDGCLAWYGRKFPETRWGNLYIEQFIGAGDFSCDAPTWQQIEQWLWDSYKYRISVIANEDGIILSCRDRSYCRIYQQDIGIYDNPIAAKIDGIIKCIQHLRNARLLAATPNNINTNSH